MTRSLAPLALIAALALPLSACGEEFSEGYKQGGIKQFAESCTEEAVKAGGDRTVSQALCSCVGEKAIEELGVMGTATGSEEELDPFIEQCSSELLDENGGLKPGVAAG